MVTFEMLLGAPSLKGLKILAGHGGMEKEIKSISVMDSPDGYRWLKGGELVLSSGFLFGSDIKLLEVYVVHLIEAGVAGLGIKKERFLNKPLDSIFQVAELHHFPIIEIPYSFSWSTVTTTFYEMFFDVQRETYIPISNDVIEQIFDAKKLSSHGLMDMLTRLFKMPVVVFTDDKKIVADNGLAEEALTGGLFEDPRFLSYAGSEAVKIDNQYLAVCRVPTAAEGQTEYIGVLSQSSHFAHELNEIFCLLYGLGKLDAKPPLNRARVYKEFVLNMLLGKVFNEDVRALESFRDTEDSIYTGVLVVYAEDVMAVCHRLGDVLNHFRNKWEISSFVLEDAVKHEAVVLLEARADKSRKVLDKWPRELFRELENCINALDEGYISMGRFYVDLKDVLLSLQEAKEAFSVGHILWEDRRCFQYSLVSVYSILRGVAQNRIDLSDIQALDDNRAYFAFDAIETVKTFIECKGYKKAADKLYIHENTLRYRIQRVESFLQMDMEDPMTLHTLFVQLNVWKLMQKDVDILV